MGLFPGEPPIALLAGKEFFGFVPFYVSVQTAFTERGKVAQFTQVLLFFRVLAVHVSF